MIIDKAQHVHVVKRGKEKMVLCYYFSDDKHTTKKNDSVF